MRKQTIIGIIIGIIIFTLCLSCYLYSRNEWKKELYSEDEEFEEYYEKFSNRNIEKLTYNFNDIGKKQEMLEHKSKLFSMSLKNAEISNKQIKLELETKFKLGLNGEDGGTDRETVNFSYYIYDNNKKLIANYNYTKESKNILPYFYRENKKEINMSYEDYFWYINDNYNLINTSYDEKICDEENSKINFIIDKRHDTEFAKFDSLTLVVYDFTFDMFIQYNPFDETKIERVNNLYQSDFFEIEIQNINY